MKTLFPAALMTLFLCSAAPAQETDLFGLENPELACLFLEEAEDIAGIAPAARKTCNTSSTKITRSTRSTKSVTGFDEIGVLRDAYRADPEATLDLIERILKAGRLN